MHKRRPCSLRCNSPFAEQSRLPILLLPAKPSDDEHGVDSLSIMVDSNLGKSWSSPALRDQSASSAKRHNKQLHKSGSTTTLSTATPEETPTSVASKPFTQATPSSVAMGSLESNLSPCCRQAQTPAGAAAGSSAAPRSASRGHTLSWKRGQEIGHGAYGRVFMAMNKVDGHIFAVKMAKFDDSDVHEKKYFEALQRELDICKDLRHRHIVSCLGHEYAKGCLYIYLEYVAGGSLRRMLEDFGPLEWSLLRKATRGLLKGLNYLHTHNPPVVHRDLKGKNILVDLDFCVKLADFGCSKRDMMSASNAIVGSLQFVAPEVMQQKGHGRKADIWSLGCVVIEMATAADPWGKGAIDNFMQAYKLIGLSQGTPPVPSSLHPVGQDLLGRCLQRAPEDRPGCAELLSHEICGASVQSRKDLPPAPPGTTSPAALAAAGSRSGSRTGPRAGSGAAGTPMISRGSSRESTRSEGMKMAL